MGEIIINTTPKLIRIISKNQLIVFGEELQDLLQEYIDKSKENVFIARNDFIDFCSLIDSHSIFFFVATDENFKPIGYLIAHLFPNGVFFIRQAYLKNKYRKHLLDFWNHIVKLATLSGARFIEANTRRNPNAYDQFAKKLGLIRECVVYRKVINHG